jgi:hypothetical protein
MNEGENYLSGNVVLCEIKWKREIEISGGRENWESEKILYIFSMLRVLLFLLLPFLSACHQQFNS